MKHYIPTLMEVYQEMIEENKINENRIKEYQDKNTNKSCYDYYIPRNNYSDTMLHNLISIINKLNNNKR